MAARVTGGKPAPEIVAQPNAVLGVTPINLYAVSMSDEAGRRQIVTVGAFGKSPEDGLPFVAVVWDDAYMQENLRIAAKPIREALLAHLGVTSGDPNDVPEHLLGAAGVGEAPEAKKGKGEAA